MYIIKESPTVALSHCAEIKTCIFHNIRIIQDQPVLSALNTELFTTDLLKCKCECPPLCVSPRNIVRLWGLWFKFTCFYSLTGTLKVKLCFSWLPPNGLIIIVCLRYQLFSSCKFMLNCHFIYTKSVMKRFVECGTISHDKRFNFKHVSRYFFSFCHI